MVAARTSCRLPHFAHLKLLEFGLGGQILSSKLGDNSPSDVPERFPERNHHAATLVVDRELAPRAEAFLPTCSRYRRVGRVRRVSMRS